MTGYFCFSFLWAIAVSNFCPMEIYQNVGLPLFTITFTVNSHPDSITINIFICFKYYTVWNQFFFSIKIHVKVFYIQIWFKCEAPLLFFKIKTMIYRKKKQFKEKHEKSIEFNVVLTWHSHAVWVDEITGVMMSIKKINKN